MREDGRPLKSRIDGKTTPRCENMSNESLGLEFCKIKVRHILFKKIGWWIFLKKPRLCQPCHNFLIHSFQTVPRPSWPCSYRNFIYTADTAVPQFLKSFFLNHATAILAVLNRATTAEKEKIQNLFFHFPGMPNLNFAKVRLGNTEVFWSKPIGCASD